jgi:hypothetical protein
MIARKGIDMKKNEYRQLHVRSLGELKNALYPNSQFGGENASAIKGNPEALGAMFVEQAMEKLTERCMKLKSNSAV